MADVCGLTPREAELGQLLASGLDLEEVAIAMGVLVEGVRMRLKVAYRNTGAKNQATLVAVVRSLLAVVGTSS